MATGALDVENEKNEALLNFNFCLVGQGMPDPASASVPLGTSPSVAADRPSIPLNRTPPWPNLYVHTYHNAVAIISRIHHGTRYVPLRLTKDQLAGLRIIEVDDKYHRVRSPTQDLDPELQGDAAGDDDSGDDLLSDDVQPIFETLDNMNMYVDLWLDPTSFTGSPAPPRAYAEVVRGLKRIGAEWGERQLRAVQAQRPALTNEWIRAVDNAQSEEPPESLHSRRQSRSEPPLDDLAILPEDAVDYRAEQDMLSRVLVRPKSEAPRAFVSRSITQLEAVAPIELAVAASPGNQPLSPERAVSDLSAPPAADGAAAAVTPSTPGDGHAPSSGTVTRTPGGRALKKLKGIVLTIRSISARLTVRDVRLLGPGQGAKDTPASPS